MHGQEWTVPASSVSQESENISPWLQVWQKWILTERNERKERAFGFCCIRSVQTLRAVQTRFRMLRAPAMARGSSMDTRGSGHHCSLASYDSYDCSFPVSTQLSHILCDFTSALQLLLNYLATVLLKTCSRCCALVCTHFHALKGNSLPHPYVCSHLVYEFPSFWLVFLSQKSCTLPKLLFSLWTGVNRHFYLLYATEIRGCLKLAASNATHFLLEILQRLIKYIRVYLQRGTNAIVDGLFVPGHHKWVDL